MPGYLVILLRLIHVGAGIFWAGSMFLLVRFLLPTAGAIGPDGGRFVGQLMQRSRLQVALAGSAVLTILSGFLLYGRLAAIDGWAASPTGMTFGLGGLAAVLALVVGLTVSAPAGRKMGQLGQSIGAGGPTPEQRETLQRLQARAARGGSVVVTLIGIAVVAMAVARYV